MNDMNGSRRDTCPLLPISSMLEPFRKNKHMEFEIRIGRMSLADSSALKISPSECTMLDGKFRTSPVFDSSRWQEGHQYHYTIHGVQHRTECVPDSQCINMHVSTITKTRLNAVSANICGDVYAKACLSKEQPLPNPSELVNSTHVRIRQRASHTYKGNGYTLRYDLSRTWSGTTKTQAERHQRDGPPCCELELELVHVDAGCDLDRLVRSLSEKTGDVARILREHM